MRDHQLKAWLRLVEAGSIRGAARSLHLSQAAITKAIRELEEDLDAPLIVRSSRGITLTECGRQLTVRARQAQNQLALARQDIRHLMGGEQARVSVAVTPMVFLSVLPDVLQDFRRSMPLADLTLEEGLMPAVLPALRAGSVDFAIAALIQETLGSDFDFEPLKTLDVMVAGRRGHPLANATRWEDLLDCDWLMQLSPGSQHTFLLEQLHGLRLPLPRRIIKTNTFGVTSSLLATTDAVSTIPSGILKIEPHSDLLTRIPVELPLRPLTLGIVTLRDNPLSLAATQLANLFREALLRANAALG